MSNPIEEALGESREHLCYSDGCSSRTFPCGVVDDIESLLAALRSGELVVIYQERIAFVESTVSSALRQLLPDIQNEEQRKLMEAAISATSHLQEFLCGDELQPIEEEEDNETISHS